MNQKIIQYGSVAVIIVAVFIAGYIILSPKASNQNTGAGGLAPIVDGKQVLAMTVKSVSYTPNSFKVKVGVPVKWEITSSGEASCDSGALVSSLLPNGSVYLNPNQGQVTIAEFTPKNTGVYAFNCPMNMVHGTIEVVN